MGVVAPIVTTVASIGGQISGAIAGRAHAKAAAKAQKQRNEIAIENAIAGYQDLDEGQRDINRHALEQSLEVQKQHLVAEGQKAAQVAALGIGGLSVSTYMHDLRKTRGENLGTIAENRETEMSNLLRQAENIRQGGIASQDYTPISKPSWTATALNAGATAVAGYGGYREAADAADQLSTGGV